MSEFIKKPIMSNGKKSVSRNKTYGGRPTKRLKKYRFNFYLIIVFLMISFYGFYLHLYNKHSISLVEAMEAQIEANMQLQDTKKSESISINKALDAMVGTPMEDAIPYIIKASEHYNIPIQLYVGIANAESSLRKFKEGCYNPWGIGNRGPLCYQNWEHGVDEFSRLIKYYYLAEGKITPEQMRDKYVGYNIGSPNWSNNVKVYYNPVVIIR